MWFCLVSTSRPSIYPLLWAKNISDIINFMEIQYPTCGVLGGGRRAGNKNTIFRPDVIYVSAFNSSRYFRGDISLPEYKFQVLIQPRDREYFKVL
jgi:hypothetical protein